ncbi:iron-containing alcohol dehydrogenase [Bradyrhizobium sp. 180]|uniref:iron-containing alcohol dehydrogenase n=1 Tax=unclassified Bradyrhizobium TaxID=2631580 RepID=UPI001FFA5557|nr:MULTISPECIES: iron-containing alcohol dehydrogenase [unclassified Bradyrhizobium]MCK1420458.1 iron-containing alcohol dehydrogenase [Bradyrhizobium sp. CW12]MCK1491670.1 iron-containing alcohol dehydrogenase [Bradyrhizobium sp. 180]MCK1531151.1 iron-containing alcohol dehydrogenase [Bradyrhizobium sp. 182]MCK1596601.1 iron-containing alcohol dehydrogenase [Bradyrhizobium sp. 164]MCK1619974.1 iron-containing alcohol dehydrogenase [Bradyrhizobium sp. 159]
MTNAFTPIEILRPTAIEFGCGTIAAAARFAERIGAKRPLVISDPFNAQRVDTLALPGSVKVFGDVKPEPDLPNLEKAVAMARDAKPDLVVGFGGGSAMDLAKLVAVMCTSDVAFADIVGSEKVASRNVALMQIPTTSGTGSEAGTRALVTDPVSQNKQAVQSRVMLADIAIVDPDLTMTVPKEVTAATGVDALAHCVEAYTSRKAHPMIDLYALEGARLVGLYLKRAVADGGDRKARAGLALASLYGGYCLGPVNTTAGHAVAYPLGTRHHVAHGLACAVIFPHTLAFNMPAVEAKTVAVLQALGLPKQGDAKLAFDATYKFCADLGIEMRLSGLGVSRDDLGVMADEAYAIRRLLDNNPRDLSRDAILHMYEVAF